MSDAPAPVALAPGVLDAVAATWRRGARVFEAAFGGGSMLPAIAPGQRVVVDCAADPGVGDVAAFRIDGRVGVHRVVRSWPDGFLSWGDANALPDQPLRREQLIGTLRDISPARRSWRRACLLALLAPAHATFERVNRRVGWAHALRRAWRGGPRAFVAACAGFAMRRRGRPRGRAA